MSQINTIRALVFIVLAWVTTVPIQASIFTYSRDNLPTEYLQSYFASWDTRNSILLVGSNWNNPYGKKIDQVSFLINDGGVPDTTMYTEQFLYYDLNLPKNIVQIREYYGDDGVLGTYKDFIESTENSFLLKFDNSMLGLEKDSFLEQGRTFEPNLFGEEIGIWHYIHSDGSLVDTYDVHSADTVDLPVTESWILFFIGIFLLYLDKLHQKRTVDLECV